MSFYCYFLVYLLLLHNQYTYIDGFYIDFTETLVLIRQERFSSTVSTDLFLSSERKNHLKTQ